MKPKTSDHEICPPESRRALETSLYHEMQNALRCLEPFRSDLRVRQTDKRTDRQTDRQTTRAKIIVICHHLEICSDASIYRIYRLSF